jgi:hypothetical protein
MTSWTLAAASCRKEGKHRRKAEYRGITRATLVCWSMISDTNTLYGVRFKRQGIGRAFDS